MKYDLLLTLGHNSSAILVEKTSDGSEGHILRGYEEERLTGVKSDSRFPINAMHECLGPETDSPEIDGIFVSHWAPDGMLSSMSKKHWDHSLLPACNRVVCSNREFTHHDGHAWSAYWYAASKPGMPSNGTMIFVIDGFGNFGEHISIYSLTGYGPKLVRRFYGYDGSLGLMYQYMTAFLGMKMHEDEYKILGYEVHINETVVDMELLHREINKEITRILDGYFDRRLVGDFDPILRLDALPALQKSLIDRWTALGKKLGIEDFHSHSSRIVFGYYIQAILEGVVLTLIKIYKPSNLICAGGVFYNVKLNRLLLDFVPGKLCIFPLAGDQGGALGLYAANSALTYPGHLNWGKRRYNRNPPNNVPGFVHLRGQDPLPWLQENIEKFGCVNLVRAAMEFGPRALCNTSTLAKPKPSVVSRINRMNGRNTIMPMAPVMNRPEYLFRFIGTDQVHLSEEHMIIAMPYRGHQAVDVMGAAHMYPNEFTGRPQVIDNDIIMDRLFDSWPVLINTSFNYHGKPIVFTMEDALYSHNKQREVEAITTVYVENDE